MCAPLSTAHKRIVLLTHKRKTFKFFPQTKQYFAKLAFTIKMNA